MTSDRLWRVRLTAAAEEDVQDILLWTAVNFGEGQARAYADTLTRAIEALMAGPYIAGARERNDIARGVFVLPVARERRRGRHIVVYRVGSTKEPPIIEVLRLLHDSMDMPRHLAFGQDNGDRITNGGRG